MHPRMLLYLGMLHAAGILPHVDYFVAHAPFARMVRRAFARLALHDALRTAEG